MQTPPRFSTATIVGLIGAVFAVLNPFLLGLGTWIQQHSTIVFSDDYMQVLTASVTTIATTLAVAWHTSPTSPSEPPA